ncbi:MAG: AAA family ATPase [Clostridiales bacterium]|jgi:ATP-dependent Clp protease ATP-binding subunit ClpA|nr:AAA family ATPase [Clostridiales bacterium]
MKPDDLAHQVYIVAVNEAQMQSHEYILPEHFLYAALLFEGGKSLIAAGGGDVAEIAADLQDFFETMVPKTEALRPTESIGLVSMFEVSAAYALSQGGEVITLDYLIMALFTLEHSYAVYILNKHGADKLAVLRKMTQRAVSREAAEKAGPDRREKRERAERQKAAPKKEDDALEKYSVNLTRAASEGRLDPLIGREEIMEKVMLALCRRLKNNPLLVGDPGVGKTAVVEGLAQKLAEGDAPEFLKGATIFSVDMAAVVAGTKYRGDFEERLLSVVERAAKVKFPIIYLDEIHTIVGAGAAEGSTDAARILKPYLAKGSVRFIGSTTFEDYKKHFEKDSALTRRFLKINVPEPDFAENVMILAGIRRKYEDFHSVVYTDEIIGRICGLSSKYLKDRAMPDKAVDVLDQAGARAVLSGRGAGYEITLDDIDECVSYMAGIPRRNLTEGEFGRVKSLEENLRAAVFGQDEAVGRVVSAIKLARAGLQPAERPVASLLFVGPTGVGKTETARQLAKSLGAAFLRFDMTEYQEKHSVARLIGAPPGYVGYEEGGLLTDAVRKTPYAVLLLDEIEKAHADILNVLLQVMDYGFLTDNGGKKADFREIILIMTSNAGARDMNKRVVGFESGVWGGSAVDKEVERVFSPEFRGRLDACVKFNPLSREMARRITERQLALLSEMLEKKNYALKVSDEVTERIASRASAEKFGAREIIHVIDSEVKRLIADKVIFSGDFDGKDKRGVIRLLLKNGEIEAEAEKDGF